MEAEGDKELRLPTSNDEQDMPVSRKVKQEPLLTQPPGKECPGNNSLGGKWSEQLASAHPTDDTRIEFDIEIDQKHKHTKDSVYKVYGQVHDSVYTALMTSDAVKNELNKRPNEEMIVYISGNNKRYVNVEMPLKCLPKNSHLHMTFIKGKTSKNNFQQYDKIDQKYFTFYISVVGRERKKIVKSNYLHKNGGILWVCGIKGQVLGDILCNDGRFLDWVNEDNWILVKDKIKYEKTTPVEKVADQEFEVIVHKKQCPMGQGQKHNKMTLQQNSKPKEQIDYLVTTQKGEQLVTVDSNFTKPEVVKGARKLILSGSKPKKSKFYVSEKIIIEIRKEESLIKNFFEEESKRTGKGGIELFNLHREEFGKVIEDAMTSKTFKTLATLVDSIGYIHVTSNESCCGTCFVFWDKYILTCRHVLNNIIKGVKEEDLAQKISESLFVTFTDENPKNSLKRFVIEPWFEVSSEHLDYAVLKLKFPEGSPLKENEIPQGLFKQKQSTELPCNGTVFIIGHPEGEVKKIDTCRVIPIAEKAQNCLTVLQDRQKAKCNTKNCSRGKERCIHMFSLGSFKDTPIEMEDCLTYHTSFFFGSSGSPVLDTSGRLVALHTAGFSYSYQGQKQSVIEFGFSINSILNDMVQNHKSWYNSVFPYQQDVEMVNADD
ncbi:serine protease FAM111A-like [Dromiciops gliroides]|uniref:serine protease FAM111A-like n=1 Tax=Dromiciops gliroides TaxID=33562 RepID=UPI001CC4A74B|nr:serine protease FAM111A-like [Dromiciops gliroides]